MNNTITQHAHIIRSEKDILLIQTKTHRDLFEIQALPSKWRMTYNLFRIERGDAVEILSQASEQQVNEKIVEFCSVSSVEEDVEISSQED